MNRQERELRLVIREMVNEVSFGDTVAQAATGAIAAAKAAFEDLRDSGGQYVYRVFPNGALQIIKSPAKNSKASPQNPLTVSAKNQYYKTIIGDLKSANPGSQTLASRVFQTIASAASSAAKAAADALSTGQGAVPAQAAPPAKVGPSDVAGTSMYGAKVVVDANNYTEYRVYTNGMIKRFGIMRAGAWKMDDPALDISAAQLKATAKAILAANQYDAAAKASLEGIIAGTLTGAGESASAFQGVMSTMRRTLASAGAPVAYIAFADYLVGRTSTWTESDLPSNYHSDLAKVAKYALSVKTPSGKKGQILHDNNFVYNNFWRNASIKLGQGVPGTPLDGQGTKGTGTVEALEFFLGGIVVTQVGQNYVISDIYDYDDYYVSPKAYDEMTEFLGALARAGTFYNVIRKAAAFRQATGYKGFPVKITLPISLAADFKV
jgi:hypothetical protein